MIDRVVIFSGGLIEDDTDFYSRYTNIRDYIIAVDKGTEACSRIGITPDLIVGDMDSVDLEILGGMKNRGVKILQFQPEKDDTDTEIAINHAISKRPDEIVIFGALGDRYDHSLSGIHLLKRCLDKGVDARIVNKKNDIRLIKSNTIIEGRKGDTISLIPLSEEVHGITTEGLYYPLNDETLYLASSRGVSNVMTKDEAKVTMKSGLLLVFKVSD